MLEDEQIFAILTKAMDPEAACKALIDAANEAGGKDNISAVYVRILGKEPVKGTLRDTVKRFSLLRLISPKAPDKKE